MVAQNRVFFTFFAIDLTQSSFTRGIRARAVRDIPSVKFRKPGIRRDFKPLREFFGIVSDIANAIAVSVCGKSLLRGVAKAARGLVILRTALGGEIAGCSIEPLMNRLLFWQTIKSRRKNREPTFGSRNTLCLCGEFQTTRMIRCVAWLESWIEQRRGL